MQVRAAFLALAIVLTQASNAGAVMMSDLYDMSKWDASYARNNGVEYFITCESGSSTQSSSPSTPPNGGSQPSGGGTPIAGGSNCGSTDPEQNKQQIWTFLKGKGLSDEAAAGIMGNMQKESSFNPTAVNQIDCKGVVQWCYGRMEDMVAKAPGGNWQCLDYQLNYMWYEMTETSESQVMEPLKGAQSAGEAANIFHDLYERSNTATGEHLGRDAMAEEIYSQFTGKSGTPTPESTPGNNSQMANNNQAQGCKAPNSSQDKEQANGSTTPGSGPIPSADCSQLTSTVRDQVASGAIILANGEGNLNQDLDNCTSGPIECNNGVSPETLRALSSTTANSGGGPVKIWSFNTGHGCDGGDHPNGRAVDIVCQGNGATGHTEECDKQYRYLYDNAAELGINDLIWTNPPPGYQCMDNGKPVSCDVFAGAGDHSDHIHVSTKSNAQAA